MIRKYRILENSYSDLAFEINRTVSLNQQGVVGVGYVLRESIQLHRLKYGDVVADWLDLQQSGFLYGGGVGRVNVPARKVTKTRAKTK